MHCSDIGAETGGICVFGDGDEDFDVVGCAATFELRLGLLNRCIRGIRSEWLADDLTLSIYSIRDPECDSTTHSTQIRGFTCVFSR